MNQKEKVTLLPILPTLSPGWVQPQEAGKPHARHIVDSLVCLCSVFVIDVHDPQRHFSSIDKETCSEADMLKVTQLVHHAW